VDKSRMNISIDLTLPDGIVMQRIKVRDDKNSIKKLVS